MKRSILVHPTGRFDNHARTYQQIEAVPIAAAMGAEIRGVIIARLDDQQFDEIRDALFHHKMIFFRGQELTRGDQAAFSLRFGPFAEDAYTRGIAEHPDVQPLIREADARDAHIFGSGWHTDSPFLAEPPAISMLYGVDIPPYGGDTIWANAALAYATLSETMQKLIAPLRVHMSMINVVASVMDYATPGDTPAGRLAALKGSGALPEDVQRKIKGAFHPLVRTHPVTGEKSLYCDGSYAVGIEGMAPQEAEALLDFLAAHLTQPAFTCRLRWEPKTLALWDNRLCVHQAFNDYDGHRRELYRTTVAGEVPR
ncbi:MAG: TauD/TfdA family dioxygenase [Gammaproteobacteria bacterium]|nr:TauD/TfdA family dioxygenase [Gammaproteobacteria bacterium]